MEFHTASHHRFNTDGKLTRGIVRVVVGTDDGIDVIHQAGVNHRTGTLPRLLTGLEQDLDGAGEFVAVIGKPEGGSEQTGHVQVMAAAVHHAFVDGAEFQPGILHNGQAVDVRAQSDAWPGPGFPLDKTHHTSFHGVGQDFDAVRLELVGQVDTSVEFLKTALGVGVQIVTDGNEFVVDIDMFTHGSRL